LFLEGLLYCQISATESLRSEREIYKYNRCCYCSGCRNFPTSIYGDILL